MDLESFITRILTKRPFVFLTGSDMTMFRNGKRSAGGIKTNQQKKKFEFLILQENKTKKKKKSKKKIKKKTKIK